MRYELSEPEQWLLLYGDILYRYGIARVRDVEIAEDLVQETLLAALKAKDNFQGQSSEQTWLIGILKHKIIDYFRKATRYQTQSFEEYDISDDYFDRQGEWFNDLSSWSKPDKSMEQDQFMLVLEACIERLSPKMAQLYMLREFDGMKSDEICELMSISTKNNFWVMLSRIRMQLRQCLEVNWINH